MLKLPSDKLFIPKISVRQGTVQNLSSKRERRLARARFIRMIVGLILMVIILLGVILFLQKLMESHHHNVTLEKQIFLQQQSTFAPSTAPLMPVETHLRSSVPPPALPPVILSEGPDNQATYQIGRQAVVPPPISPPPLPEPTTNNEDEVKSF